MFTELVDKIIINPEEASIYLDTTPVTPNSYTNIPITFCLNTHKMGSIDKILPTVIPDLIEFLYNQFPNSKVINLDECKRTI